MTGAYVGRAARYDVTTSPPSDGSTRARAGRLTLTHGTVETPQFMPVGTNATVKALSPDDIREVGASIILSNTYHLYLRPGHERIERLGGLHRFMDWDGPILTDSGGFQVVSLGDLRVVDEGGVTFRSHIDGSTHTFTPELATGVQEALGSDIAVAFDQPVFPSSPRAVVADATERTHRWAERCVTAHTREDQALFGIVQGGVDEAMRAEGIQTPVLMLTALDDISDRITGLDRGADDYLAKPFSMDELRARVRALGRRRLEDRAPMIQVGDLELEMSDGCIGVGVAGGRDSKFGLSGQQRGLQCVDIAGKLSAHEQSEA